MKRVLLQCLLILFMSINIADAATAKPKSKDIIIKEIEQGTQPPPRSVSGWIEASVNIDQNLLEVTAFFASESVIVSISDAVQGELHTQAVTSNGAKQQIQLPFTLSEGVVYVVTIKAAKKTYVGYFNL